MIIRNPLILLAMAVLAGCFFKGTVLYAQTGSSQQTSNSSVLQQANTAYGKSDYTTALNLYQTALQNNSTQPSQNTSSPLPVATPSITQKIMSLFKPNSTPPTPNPNSKNYLDGFICLQMGKCYVQLKKMDKAEGAFSSGVTMGGDNDTGNTCLFEQGNCQMYRLDYQDAYQNLKEYVRRNVDKDPSQMDPNRMTRAIYLASACAWKLNMSGVAFENDMPGAKTLAKKAYTQISALDRRVYFKK